MASQTLGDHGIGNLLFAGTSGHNVSMPKSDLVNWKEMYDVMRDVNDKLDDLKSQVATVKESVGEVRNVQANQQGKITGISIGITSAMSVFSFLINYFVFKRQ